MNLYWQKIEEAIAIAPNIPTEQRGEWLAEFCGGDEKLKAEIESLLAFERQSEQFLEKTVSPYAASILNDTETDVSGKQFGHYQIIKEIGRGGMGAVFLARRSDGEFEQKVALKIIRQTVVDRETENRFRRERQILAALNHPNIAKLLDGGVSESGEPFLVMEYVGGKPLTEFTEMSALSIAERLNLFIKICAAVSFAHQNLIVHRDIKPSNILVTETGEPKLLDFGLAKVLDFETDTEQTATAFRAMTPAYASPEQMRGENITTASDIYSLGIVLYEILTGMRPFDFQSNNFEEMRRVISTAEPLRPSAARDSRFQIPDSRFGSADNPKIKSQNLKLLKGDLDNIVLTTLRKEPARRYKSVAELSDDIERHLKGLPVKARPNTFSYRTGKFFKRNWAVSSVAVLLLLSLFTGLAAFAWQAKVAAAQRDRAEKRFGDVRKLSSSLLFEISPQIEHLPGSTQARETIVLRALEYLDSLATEAADNESLQSELATAYEQVGDVQGKPGKANLGDLKGATESYLKAQKIRLVLTDKHPDDFELQKLIAANYFSIGQLILWSGDVEATLENYRRALAIYENLATREPENSAVNLEVIQTQMSIGTTLSFNNRRKESILIFRQMMARLEELKASNAADIETLRLLENVHIYLGYDLSWQDEMKEAEGEVKKALAIGEPLLAANPENTEVQRALWLTNFLAGGIFEDADANRSRGYLEKSVTLAKQTVENDKFDVQAKHDLAQSYSKLSVIAVNQKKFDEAISLLEQAQVILTELTTAEPRHSGYAFSLANNFIRLGEAQSGKGDLIKARQSYEQALALQEKMHETDATDNSYIRSIAVSSQQIADIYEKLKQYDKAVEFDKKSSAMFDLLKQNNAFDEYDKKTVEDLEKSLNRCQRKIRA